MKQSTRSYPRVQVDTARSTSVDQAGGVLLTRTVEVTGLVGDLREHLGRWRAPLASHDPGKIVSDLVLSLALGGDCLADIAKVRAEPGVYGPVASDPTVSRLLSALSADPQVALKAINAARAAARERAWSLAADLSPGHDADADDPVVIDVDATIVIAHSEKEQAAGTYKRSYGFHPVRREALLIRAEVRDHRHRSCRSRTVKLRTA